MTINFSLSLSRNYCIIPTVYFQFPKYTYKFLVHIQFPEGSLCSEQSISVFQWGLSLRLNRAKFVLLHQIFPVLDDLVLPILHQISDRSIFATVLDGQQVLWDLFVQRLLVRMNVKLKGQIDRLEQLPSKIELYTNLPDS